MHYARKGCLKIMNRCDKYDACRMDKFCPYYLNCVIAEMDDYYGDYEGDEDGDDN